MSREKTGILDKIAGMVGIEDKGYRFPFRRSSATYSLVRIASARIVHVTFLSAFVTNGPPSATKRFFTSWAWPCSFNAEVRGLVPIRVVPTSWTISPPVEIP
jgi:hypothetical protein